VFEDVFDWISKMFSWRWPTVEGVITAIGTDPVPRGEMRLTISYEFSVAGDGPYTGEYHCGAQFFPAVNISEDNTLLGKAVTVRYRPDDPSVNTLDPAQWQGF
jgi:hypothetical protein